MPRTVGWVLPTVWDRKQLEACRSAWEGRVEPRFLGPEDAEVPWDFDVAAWLERTQAQARGIDGFASSSDYPGAALAALLAERAGSPGSDPRAVLRVGDKGLARQLHARAVPEAVPWFRRLDPLRPEALPGDLEFPCFVKPARGSFSVLSRPIADAAALGAYLGHPEVRAHRRGYVEIHRRLARLLDEHGPDPGDVLVEGLLHGVQVTVEGWAALGRIATLGIVDSVMVPGTHAFARFEAPSALPAPVQSRLRAVADVAVRAAGLHHGGFNVELFWDEARDRVALIEVNPRLCGQFGDLWLKVHGTSTYEDAMTLALGGEPRHGGGRPPWRFAASVPLRTFEPVVVERAPSPASIREVEAAFPGTLVWWECEAGEVLSGFDAAGERQGYRYAVLNVGADTRAGLAEKARAVEQALDAVLRPLAPPERAGS